MQSLPKRKDLYSKLARHVPTAIEKLVSLLESRQPNIQLGAINTILNKCLPDLKAIEVGGNVENPIRVKIVTEYDRVTDKELPEATKDIRLKD